jgi:UDP-N-acetylmuramate: L-alanyl-gamma-D-glutamyl-meso-diaminopimelate ligase
MKRRHPRRRLVVFFQPRYTGGRRGAHQRDLPEILAAADVVVISPSLEIMEAHKTFSQRVLCRELASRGIDVHAVISLDLMEKKAGALCRDGDIVIIAIRFGCEATARRIVGAVITASQRQTTV